MFTGLKKVLENLTTPRKIPERPLSLAWVLGGFGSFVVVIISMIAIANYQIADERSEEAAFLRQAIAGEQLNTDRIQNEIQGVEYEQDRISSLIEISRSQSNELTSSIDEAEFDIIVVSEEITAVEDEISKIESQKSDIETKISFAEDEIHEIKEELK